MLKMSVKTTFSGILSNLTGKKTSHHLFYDFLTGSIIFLMGNILTFVRVRVRLFLELKMDILYKVAIWSLNFVSVHAR